MPLDLTRYPRLCHVPSARDWLEVLQRFQRAENTLAAYASNLDDFFGFLAARRTTIQAVDRRQLADYVESLSSRPRPRSRRRDAGLANATIQQRLTTLRLYFDFLVEGGLVEFNPVGRGRYRPGSAESGQCGLLRRQPHLPWLPDETEWSQLVAAASDEPLRNRLMFALAYACALRREEVCALHVADLDFANRLVQVRAATTKTGRARVIPYSRDVDALLVPYLRERRRQRHDAGPLFLFEGDA